LTSAAQFQLIDLILAMTVDLPLWHAHCTWARFTVLVSGSGELATHSCPLLCLQSAGCQTCKRIVLLLVFIV